MGHTSSHIRLRNFLRYSKSTSATITYGTGKFVPGNYFGPGIFRSLFPKFLQSILSRNIDESEFFPYDPMLMYVKRTQLKGLRNKKSYRCITLSHHQLYLIFVYVCCLPFVFCRNPSLISCHVSEVLVGMHSVQCIPYYRTHFIHDLTYCCNSHPELIVPRI